MAGETREASIFGADDPIALFREWLAAAERTEPYDPNAIALATVDGAGLPNVRMVLLKAVEDDGFAFYTNFESAKGTEIAANPRAAFVIHWKTQRRQIRVRGAVERVEDETADAYYASRPLDSRLGAWASRQSRPLDTRELLEAELEAARERFGETPPRPSHWGGLRIDPVEIEFWADGAFRLHDREIWTRTPPTRGWYVKRLFP